jgi:hypothetical protein
MHLRLGAEKQRVDPPSSSYTLALLDLANPAPNGPCDDQRLDG